jgi:hypothetical protein
MLEKYDIRLIVWVAGWLAWPCKLEQAFIRLTRCDHLIMGCYTARIRVVKVTGLKRGRGLRYNQSWSVMKAIDTMNENGLSTQSFGLSLLAVVCQLQTTSKV